MRIKRVRWDEQNLDHITRHQVEQDEVESVAFGPHHVRRGRQENRYELYGQTDEGRYLFIIIDREVKGVFYVVTAREMDVNEKRFYRRKTIK